MKNKRGVSGVIAVVLMVALVMVIAVIVWVVVRNIVQQNLEGVESCFGLYDKVKINSMYTCYNTGSNNSFQFSISIEDVTIDSLVVSIAAAGTTKSYTLSSQNQTIAGLGPYPSGSGTVILPGKNSGLTYISSEFSTKPDSIQIAPIIGGEQCDVSDSLTEIDNCATIS